MGDQTCAAREPSRSHWKMCFIFAPCSRASWSHQGTLLCSKRVFLVGKSRPRVGDPLRVSFQICRKPPKKGYPRNKTKPLLNPKEATRFSPRRRGQVSLGKRDPAVDEALGLEDREANPIRNCKTGFTGANVASEGICCMLADKLCGTKDLKASKLFKITDELHPISATAGHVSVVFGGHLVLALGSLPYTVLPFCCIKIEPKPPEQG